LPKINIFDLLIEIVYLSIIFLIPIWFAFFFQTFNMFELNKMVLFKILVLALLFLVGCKIIIKWDLILNTVFSKKTFVLVFKKYFLFPAIFLFGLGLSLLFSADFLTSFFGSYDRQQGFLSYLYYFLFFGLLILSFLITDSNISSFNKDLRQKKINRIIYTIFFTGTFVALYGVLQIIGIDFFPWPESPLLNGRIVSSFGQPNFLASFLLLVIPIAVYLFQNTKAFLQKFFYLLVLGLELVGLILTASRAAILSLFIAVVVYSLYLIWTLEIKIKNKIIIFAISLAILLSLVFSLESFMPGRLSSSLDYHSGSFATRISFFSAAADSIIKKPLFGYGLEIEDEVFIKYYQKDWAVNGDVSANTDRAHNLILDILLSSGLLGLLSFLLLYYLFFNLARENIIKNKNKPLTQALAFGAFAYSLSLLAGFSVVSTELYFWLFLALLALINYSKEQGLDYNIVITSSFKKNIFLKSSLIIILLIFCFWQIIVNLKILKADYYFNKAFLAIRNKEYGAAIVLSQDIRNLEINISQQSYYNDIFGTNLSVIYDSTSDLSTKKIIKDELMKIYDFAPSWSYKGLLLKAKIAVCLGEYSTAEKYFNAIEEINNVWPLLYLEKANFFLKINNFQAAKEAYLNVDKNLPDLNDPFIVKLINQDHRAGVMAYKYYIYKSLGDIFFQEENYELAEHYYLKAYLNDVSDYTLFKKIADTYYLRDDLQAAIRYNKQGEIRNPKDYAWSLALAELYRELNDMKQAQVYINKALELTPNNMELIKIKSKINTGIYE